MDPHDLAAFLGTALVVYWCGMTLINARRRVRNIADIDKPATLKPAGSFRRALAGALPQSFDDQDRIERDLKRAGYYGMSALVEYLAARNSLVIGWLLIGGGLAVAAPPGSPFPKMVLIGTVIAVLASYLLPWFLLRWQANRRLNRIETGLPDVLDLIRMCLTGGLSLRDSLERVAQEIELFHPDLAVELEVIRRHAEADTMAKALKEFARRMKTPDVSALASLVSQTERLGTHVAQAVMEFADGVRRQHRQRAEERASKVSIRMLFPVIFCLAPPVFILLLGPPAIQLKNFVRDSKSPGGVLNVQSYQELERTTNTEEAPSN
ncbi:MAG: type II secretion system F family protein [Planctomycetaceae bacterium]|nr:type II secretion system F family protein [Planctomycetaceae bacterium]